MALVLDSDQTLLSNTAVEFARARLPIGNLRQLRDSSDADGFDRAVWREMAELGWTGMLIPEELGGNGFGYFGLGLVMEALGRTLAASPTYSTVVLCGSAMILSGSSERARALLRQIAGGEIVVAFAADESAHHRPYAIETSAVRKGDHYVLSGEKRFVADGHVADHFVVIARTSGAQGSSDGLSMFVVDAKAPGVRRRRRHMVDSRNAADVEFESSQVPMEALLGTEGAAGKVLDAVLDRGRILLAAEMLGMGLELFDITIGYLKQRTQFGVPIGSFQALKHRAVQMFAELEMSRSVVLEALTALDENRPDVPRLASVCKARLNDTLTLVTNESVQLHGGIGVTDEIDVGLYLKRARIAQATLGNTAFHLDRYATLCGF